MAQEDYPTTEQRIHDYLELLAENLIINARAEWKQKQKIRPTLMVLSVDSVKTDDGFNCSTAVMDLTDEPREGWEDLVLEIVERMNAFSVILVFTAEDELKAVMETPRYGTTWTIPIKWQGEVRVLKGATKERGKSLFILHDPLNTQFVGDA